MDITDVLRKAENWLVEVKGVEGVAQGKFGDEDCITVFLSAKEATNEIPRNFHGYKVCVEYTGDFHIQE